MSTNVLDERQQSVRVGEKITAVAVLPCEHGILRDPFKSNFLSPCTVDGGQYHCILHCDKFSIIVVLGVILCWQRIQRPKNI